MGNFSSRHHPGGVTATVLGLELNENSEQVVTLSSQERDFSVGMETEGKRSFWGQFGFDVLQVILVSSGNGALG